MEPPKTTPQPECCDLFVLLIHLVKRWTSWKLETCFTPKSFVSSASWLPPLVSALGRHPQSTSFPLPADPPVRGLDSWRDPLQHHGPGASLLSGPLEHDSCRAERVALECCGREPGDGGSGGDHWGPPLAGETACFEASACLLLAGP